MMRRAGYGLLVLTAVLALPAIALDQRGGPISVDLSVIETDAEPAGFTFWHTGEDEPGKWGIIADRTAADGLLASSPPRIVLVGGIAEIRLM